MVKWFIFGGIALLVGGIWIADELGKADRDSTGQVVDAGDESVLDLRLGDCLLTLGLEADDAEETDASVDLVPCQESHVYEVFGVDPGAFSDLEAPNTAIFQDRGDEYCFDTYNVYAKSDIDNSDLTYTYLYPTQESWSQGDRELICLAHYDDYSLWQGSIRG